jgi:hypothetical protein
MDRSFLFYAIFGATVVIVPALCDRALKDRLSTGPRYAVSLLVTVLASLLLVLIARLVVL